MNDKTRFFIATALYSFAANMFVSVLSYFMIQMNGSDILISTAMALFFLFYGIGCLIKLPEKSIISSSISSIAGILSALNMIIIGIILKLDFQQWFIYPVLILVALTGGIQSQFFPVMMNKTTEGLTGTKLSRQLTLYNFSWSLPFFLVPILGGLLLEIDYSLTAFIIAGGYLCAALFSFSKPTYKATDTIEKPSITPVKNHVLNENHRNLIIISRISLFTISFIFILFKTNLAVYMKDFLGKTEKDFGLINTIINAANVMIFFIAGVVLFWKNKPRLLTAIQILLIPALLIIPLAATHLPAAMWILSISALCAGAINGFIYTSHQYYAINYSADSRKAASMHELTISAGFITGSAAAALTENISFEYFYPAIAVISLVSILSQLGFGLYRKKISCNKPA